jgi:hypothetical protein
MLRRSPAFRSPPAASAIEASIDLSRETALAAVMDWVSLYVPTWGTSIILHLAVVILAAFMAVQIQAEPTFDGVTMKPTPLPPAVGPRKLTTPPGMLDDRRTGHGLKTPTESSSVALEPDKMPGIGRDPAYEDLPIIGTGGGRKGGESEGLGDGPGRGGGVFPPETQEGRRIVYVVDRSGSMTDSLEFVKYELKRSLQEMPETSQFHIIFFSSGPPVEMSARRLMAATERNRGLAMEFIDTVIATGGTDPVQALERAFAVQPDVIYLLTDGEFDKAIIDYVKRLNVGGKVKVLTIGFLYRPDNEVLQAIAAQNGGAYKFVSEGDLVEIVGR